MKTILFPTDLSQSSLGVLDYTIAMCKDYDAQLIMLHVYQPTMSPRRPFLDEGNIRRQRMQDLFGFGRDKLRKMAPEMVKHRVVEGFTIPKLISICHQDSVNLIVMAKSNDNTWIYKYLLSKILSISGTAPCPVLIIPPEETYRPFERISITYGQHPSIDKYVQSYLEIYFNRDSTYLHYFPVLPMPNKGLLKKFPTSRIRSKLKSKINDEKIDLMIMTAQENFLKEWFQTTPIPRSFVFDLNIPVMVFNPNAVNARRISMISPTGSTSKEIYDLTG